MDSFTLTFRPAGLPNDSVIFSLAVGGPLRAAAGDIWRAMDMTKEQRKLLLAKIVAAINEMTAEQSARQSVVTIGGHTIARRLLYAGGSQWCGCGRDWDSVESGWGWVVDGEYRLTTPDLFGFDGHNIIERQTPYYLQDGYDEQTAPEHDGRDEIDRVPSRILLAIGRGLIEARQAAQAQADAESEDAEKILRMI